jgi:tetratricopeptide (TPR) repeat protein
MDDSLRALWDWNDLDGSESRFRALLAEETSDVARAEVLTQLARIHGLRGDFDDGDALLDDAASLAGTSPVAAARIDLERGRLRRSSGDPDAARPLFESAYAGALEATQHYLAADAAHMVALVAGSRDGFVDWTRRGIELAEMHDGASYWLGPLLNNLGWEYYDAGDFEPALDAFERALVERERDPGNAAAIELALYGVGKTLRALGRAEDAVPLLERAVASAKRRGHGDGWLHEELAEEYVTLGRDADARVQATLAVPLLERDDPSLGEDAGRRARLAALAAA